MGFIPLNGKTFEDCLFDAKCFVVGQCVTFSYFCGTEENCIKACQLNDKLLMQNIYQRTLQQVDQIYSVVLVLENMKNSFRLLEAMHPQFFAGITKKMQGRQMPVIEAYLRPLLRSSTALGLLTDVLLHAYNFF